MRFLTILFYCLTLGSCSLTKPTSQIDPSVLKKQKTVGTVSHQFKKTGCNTVVIVKTLEGSKLILIPKDNLEDKFDKDGLNIFFNYLTLKMPQPKGCLEGIPAEISDISIN